MLSRSSPFQSASHTATISRVITLLQCVHLWNLDSPPTSKSSSQFALQCHEPDVSFKTCRTSCCICIINFSSTDKGIPLWWQIQCLVSPSTWLVFYGATGALMSLRISTIMPIIIILIFFEFWPSHHHRVIHTVVNKFYKPFPEYHCSESATTLNTLGVDYKPKDIESISFHNKVSSGCSGTILKADCTCMSSFPRNVTPPPHFIMFSTMWSTVMYFNEHIGLSQYCHPYSFLQGTRNLLTGSIFLVTTPRALTCISLNQCWLMDQLFNLVSHFLQQVLFHH